MEWTPGKAAATVRCGRIARASASASAPASSVYSCGASARVSGASVYRSIVPLAGRILDNPLHLDRERIRGGELLRRPVGGDRPVGKVVGRGGTECGPRGLSGLVP